MSALNHSKTAGMARCPSFEALSRAFSDSASGCAAETASVHRHLSGCESCSREWRGLEQLVQAGQQLPAPSLAPDRSEAMRTALLLEAGAVVPQRSANPCGHAWRRSAAVGGLFLAAAAALLWVGIGRNNASSDGASDDDQELAAGSAEGGATVQAPDGAQFVHTAKPLDGGIDEIVRLKRGRVTVAVRDEIASRRFRVVTGDAELESRAGDFDVEVSDDDRLLAVVVHSGNVRVRVHGQQTVLLGAGERFQPTVAVMGNIDLKPDDGVAEVVAERVAEVVAERVAEVVAERVADRVPEPPGARHPLRAEAQRKPAALSEAATDANRLTTGISTASPEPARLEPAARVRKTRPPAPRAARPIDVAFQRGWSFMRSGRDDRFAAAAAAFAEAISLAPSDPMAEDARYWRAVALARAGDTAAAATAMTSFLKQHSSSSRAPEISVMLGWIELENGNYAPARRHFQAGLGNRTSNVRQSARAGLASLPARNPRSNSASKPRR